MNKFDRDALWTLLKENNQTWDMVIIGGGITGVGILREAARLGLNAVLFEQKDYAWGTSSRSSKMVHGGLRYIAQGDLKLTKQCVLERERLIEEAPGLVERLTYLFPIRRAQVPGKMVFNSLLAIYDKLAGIKTHGYLSAKQVQHRVPGLNPERLKGASYYTDAVTDDARLVLRVLHEALKDGGFAGNYIPVDRVLFDSENRVNGVKVTNSETDETVKVNAKVVINATGAWVDSIRAPVAGEHTIRPLRGSHIVIPKNLAPVNDALTLFHPQDKRAVFIFPWENRTVIGTTDLDHDTDLNIEPSITQQEVDYLLHLAQVQFPDSGIDKNSIISTYAGVRPVISKNKNKPPSKEKRDHKVWQDKGLISVSGGKLTTFRLIALDVIKTIQPYFEELSISGLNDHVLSPTAITPDQLEIEPQLSSRLVGCYGEHAKQLAEEAEPEQLKLIDATRYCLAELNWCAQHESVVHLDDLLLRRTRIGLLMRNGAADIIDTLEPLFRNQLGWTEQKWQQEKQRYLKLWQQHYSIPNE